MRRRPPMRPGETNRQRGRDGADEVAREDDGPVARQGRGAHPAARPRHHDEVVAGEEFRARHDDEDEAEREGHSCEEAHHSIRQRAPAGRDGRCEDRAQGDEGAREHGEHEHVEPCHPRLRDTDRLGLAGHIRRGKSVEPTECERRRGCPEDCVARCLRAHGAP